MMANTQTKKRVKVWLVLAAACAWIPALSSADESTSAGVVDVHAVESSDTRTITTAFWGEKLAMGLDADFVSSEFVSSSLGAYYRHALDLPGSEWVLGGNADIDTNGMNSHELQFQHKLSRTLGYGAGLARLADGDQDIWFAKLIFAKRFGRAILEVNPQVQSVNGNASAGLHVIHFTDDYLAGAGHDGEQWRAVVGFAMPDTGTRTNPAAEIFVWSSDVGRERGDDLVFVNGTLRYTGGLLSNAARMGRALGAGGVFFDNPISYLSLGWNRTPGIWEIGDIWNVRLVDSNSSVSGRSRSFQTAVFPAQFNREANRWDGLFVGYANEFGSGSSSESLLFGYFQRAERVSFGLSAQQAISGSGLSVSVGFRMPTS